MTVTYGQPVQVGRSFVITWSSDLAGSGPVTFYVWINGKSVGPTQATSTLVHPGDQLEVFDVPDITPDPFYPRVTVLQWLGTSGASPDHYRVDEQINSVWVERLKIKHDNAPYYQFTSRELEDDTVHTFRVVPVSATGLEGTAREFVLLMVRRPDAPNVSYSYNNQTGSIRIAAT